MNIFCWDAEKNKKIQAERDLSFEQIEFAIENNQLLDILRHPNQQKYPDQILLIIQIEQNVVVVPAVKEKRGFFLKTAFYSRKMTRKYLGGTEV